VTEADNRGGGRVIKLGGRVQQDPALPAAIAAAWTVAPGALCVVHGGGDEVSALQGAMGIKPRFLGGRRVTGQEDIALLRMALSGVSNKQLVSALVGAGIDAIGLSGEDAGLVIATRSADVALGLVGDPTRISVSLLSHLLRGGYLPVISPLSRAEGEPAGALNVNGDDAAAAIAVALGAAELLLVADVPGVLVSGAPRASLDAVEARALIASGEASGGMAAKLEAALGALARGVKRVRIGNVAAISDASLGTSIVAGSGPLKLSTTARASTGAAGGSSSVRSLA